MAFLFKSRKSQQNATTTLPPVSRNVHTSEGPSSGASPALLNGTRERDGAGVISPTPSGSVNNSLNSLSGANSPDPVRARQRADSESQVSSQAYRDWPRTKKKRKEKAYPIPSGSSVSSVERMLILDERFHDLNRRRMEPPPLTLIPPFIHGPSDGCNSRHRKLILSHDMEPLSMPLPRRKGISI